MILQIADYNGSDQLVQTVHGPRWGEVDATLSGMPLHLKGSDQAGMQGNAIFDPVGTNSYISSRLSSLGWQNRIGLPEGYRYLGSDIDYGKGGVFVEVQFSNYPFLPNNVLRAEVLFREGVALEGTNLELLVVVTKGRMFPASQSTLHFEQAKEQLSAFCRHRLLSVPVRLVGLFVQPGSVLATWTEYSSPRYSRAVKGQSIRTCEVVAPASPGGRHTIRVS